MDIKDIDNRIEHLDCILESCENPELRAHYKMEREGLGEQKLAIVGQMKTTVLNQEAAGLITEAAADELMVQLEDAELDAIYDTYDWYEDVSIAAGVKLALNELAAFSSAMIAKITPGVIGKALTIPVKKFIFSRLSKYTMLHNDAVDFKSLKATKYDLIEAEKRGIEFKHALKWLDKGFSRIHVVLYSYKGKDVMGIAYTKDVKVGLGGVGNSGLMNAMVEPVIKDGNFKKHQDYYVACMCTKLQMTHPCVRRLFDQMKKEWSAKVDELKQDVQESVEESVANGTFEDRLMTIYEAAEDGHIHPKDAINYVRMLKQAEIHFDEF